MIEFILLLMCAVVFFFGPAIAGYVLGTLGGILFKLFFPVIKIISRSYARWDGLPTLKEYLSKNPVCNVSHGVTCSACNSGSIKNWGVSHIDSKYRIFICNHCDTDLYKK